MLSVGGGEKFLPQKMQYCLQSLFRFLNFYQKDRGEERGAIEKDKKKKRKYAFKIELVNVHQHDEKGYEYIYRSGGTDSSKC